MEDEWFEISDSDWLEDGFIGKELKLLVDAQFPQPVFQEIRAAGIKIDQIPSSQKRRDDTDILALAEKQEKVLLTLDKDFWDDRKQPLHTLKTGDHIYRGVPCFSRSNPTRLWHCLRLLCQELSS